MPLDHSAVRNTFVSSSNDPDTKLGGIYASPGITNHNFHSMVEMICLFEENFVLRDESGDLVERDDYQLQPGNYYIATTGRSLPYVHRCQLLTPNRFDDAQRESPASSDNFNAVRNPHFQVL
ncbi:hypothetical protein HOY82DRAFT_600875 [Tuber indicum]|nr:hypothetical protein HOY82DRAFT_600875 [Tuber indicum]